MSFLIRKLASMAVRKIATDPAAREKAGQAARKVSEEAKVIARSENKSYEAGRSVRRILNSLKSEE